MACQKRQARFQESLIKNFSLLSPAQSRASFLSQPKTYCPYETLTPPHKGLNQIYETTSTQHLKPNETFFSFAVNVSQPKWNAGPSG